MKSVESMKEKEKEFTAGEGCSSNPIIPGLYADPDVIRANGRYYLYPTTDGFTWWSGHEFYVFSSEDKLHWKNEGKILDLKKDVPWATGSAWAPCVAAKEGRYYFYFCGKKPDGESSIGVAVAESPTGPFLAREEPLVTLKEVRSAGIPMGQTIDPSVYTENGTTYLFFGNGRAACAELGEDMVSLRPGTLTEVEGLYDFREALHVLKRGEFYHFSWSCDDTGSENYHVNYGISKSLRGPVEYQYPILEKRPGKNILGTGHHTILQEEDRYTIFYHRFGTPLEKYPEGKGFHRELCMNELHFSPEGKILPVEPT